jgi:two-component system OmpR family response regulator
MAPINRNGEVSMEKKTHILVVDDDLQITKLVERTLVEAGFAVTVANDGDSALARLAEREPDLVLLDIRMPGLDGFQVLERIRKSSNVPVLMLTAVSEESAVAYSLGIGADDYITKPFLTRLLVARIRAKLRRARGEMGEMKQE